ncbi:aminoglycoside phosphotransferase family protein [Sphaerisporangium aureirubrum]|uniref:Aminoglycoside phosphotransferase family protein n=1 Tax=Sphaerisporangium aureirubrum TaxID=1544736 RepID=A0ABW1N9Q1_9ACTN
MRAGKMHADETDHDVPLVRRLIAAQFPQWSDLPVEPFDSSGTDNAIYRLGADMSVRLPRRPGSTTQIAKDLHWLPKLAPLLPFPIPVPLAAGEPAEDYPLPWSVHRWLDGENPAPGHLTRPALLAEDLAAFITAFRRIDLPGAPPAYRGGPLEKLDLQTRTAIHDLGASIDPMAATAAWEAALNAPGWTSPPVWTHADLMPGNLLVTDGRLTAVIDFSTAGRGDPAADLMIAWNLLPATVREDFREAVKADDATWSRARGRALSIALIALPYYKATNPAFAANARHVIQEVLTDHQHAGDA